MHHECQIEPQPHATALPASQQLAEKWASTLQPSKRPRQLDLCLSPRTSNCILHRGESFCRFCHRCTHSIDARSGVTGCTGVTDYRDYRSYILLRIRSNAHTPPPVTHIVGATTVSVSPPLATENSATPAALEACCLRTIGIILDLHIRSAPEPTRAKEHFTREGRAI